MPDHRHFVRTANAAPAFACLTYCSTCALDSLSPYRHQLQRDVRHAVLGNAGTLISFRVGAEDAAHLAREFKPVFDSEYLIGVPNYRVYLRLMIDGEPSKAFSVTTMPNTPNPKGSGTEHVLSGTTLGRSFDAKKVSEAKP